MFTINREINMSKNSVNSVIFVVNNFMDYFLNNQFLNALLYRLKSVEKLIYDKLIYREIDIYLFEKKYILIF
jgi:hypothetical protein